MVGRILQQIPVAHRESQCLWSQIFVVQSNSISAKQLCSWDPQRLIWDFASKPLQLLPISLPTERHIGDKCVQNLHERPHILPSCSKSPSLSDVFRDSDRLGSSFPRLNSCDLIPTPPWPWTAVHDTLEDLTGLSPGSEHKTNSSTALHYWAPAPATATGLPGLLFSLTIQPRMGKILQMLGIGVVAGLTSVRSSQTACGSLSFQPFLKAFAVNLSV